MKFNKIYLIYLLLLVLGGSKLLFGGQEFQDFKKIHSSSKQFIFQQDHRSPLETPTLPNENQKENENEFKDDSEDDKDNGSLLIGFHSLSKNIYFKISGTGTFFLSYFFHNKQIPLFILFHSWKSHISHF